MNHNYNCNCTYCTQFFFARNNKKIYEKKLKNDIEQNIKNNQNNLNQLKASITTNEINFNNLDDNTNNTDISMTFRQKINKNLNENNELNYDSDTNFTLKDMDVVYQLNLMNLNSNDISNITKISKSVVEYILDIINWKK